MCRNDNNNAFLAEYEYYKINYYLQIIQTFFFQLNSSQNIIENIENLGIIVDKRLIKLCKVIIK